MICFKKAQNRFVQCSASFYDKDLKMHKIYSKCGWTDCFLYNHKQEQGFLLFKMCSRSQQGHFDYQKKWIKGKEVEKNKSNIPIYIILQLNFQQDTKINAQTSLPGTICPGQIEASTSVPGTIRGRQRIALLQLRFMLMSIAPVNHVRPWRCQGSRLIPEDMVLSKGHAAAGALQIWVAYIVTQSLLTSGPELQCRAMSVSVPCSNQCLCCYPHPCYQWRLCGCPGSGSPTGTMLVSKGLHTVKAMPIWVACVATQGYSYILAQAAAENDVWVSSLIAAQVCIDVHGPCCHQRR